jgi:guanylate cyclase
VTSATEPPERTSFLQRLEGKYRPSPGATFLEDATTMVRLSLINGALIVANTVFVAALLFANDEEAVAWTVAAVGVVFLLSVLAFIVTGRVSLYIHGMLWPSLVQNIAAHVMLGGFVWSGAILFWGIIVSVVAALLLGRMPGAILGGAYIVAAIVFAFLEPALQARRPQPALAVSVGLAVNVFVLSVLILVPVVMSLMAQIIRERARSEGLLLNVLPTAIAQRLKRSPGVIADAHESCTVMFADIVGFTDHTTRISPEQLIAELNLVFSRFDALVEDLGAEKIKTMGDGYLAVAGAPNRRPDHAAVMCELALRMQEAMPEINRELGLSLQLRVGLHTGPVVAGVVGTSRFSYDLWGHTVNLASRMETLSPPGGIHATDALSRAAGESYVFERRGVSEVKGVGTVSSCLLAGRRTADQPGAPVTTRIT